MKTQIPSYISVLAILVFPLVVLVFANTVLAEGPSDNNHEHGQGFSLFSLVKLFGVAALICLLVTFSVALFRRKLGPAFLKIHRTFAWLTIIFALCHGIMILVFF